MAGRPSALLVHRNFMFFTFLTILVSISNFRCATSGAYIFIVYIASCEIN